MKFWNSVCQTNPKETKPVDFPFKHTSISAQFQIKHATEQWGIMGHNWGVRGETFTPLIINGIEEQGFLFYQATLYYPEGELPIHADINFFNRTSKGFKIENDLMKKVATDALTKGLSKLGFNSDVFEGLFDDNKYVQRMIKLFVEGGKDKKEEDEEEKRIKAIEDLINNSDSEDSLKGLWDGLSESDKKLFGKKIVDKKKEIQKGTEK